MSEELKKRTPDIPWKEMGTMRNILVHEYFAVDDDLIWDVAVKDIPKIRQRIEEIYCTLPEEKTV